MPVGRNDNFSVAADEICVTQAAALKQGGQLENGAIVPEVHCRSGAGTVGNDGTLNHGMITVEKAG